MAKIPKIIHYCWVGGITKPKSVEYCIESWKRYCPDYEIKEWNETNYDFTKNQYMAEAYEAKKWGFVPDYARLDIIYEYGGIYLDTDVEIVKNFDELLEYDAFFGFENTGYEELFVNCGHGFGACPHHEIIKWQREKYSHIHFKNDDGTLHMLPSPHYTTDVLCQNGLKRINIDQDLGEVKVFASDVLCPKNFRTGKIKRTLRTVSIHHFTASWLDETIKKELLHQQKINHFFGKKLGSKVLYIESVINKYTFLEMIFVIFQKFSYIFKQQMINAKDNYLYNKYLLLTRKSMDGSQDYIILDTYMCSDNQGDGIIMENCMNQLSDVIDTKTLKHIPTHRFINDNEKKQLRDSKAKILCGTNILSGHMRTYGLWKLSPDIVPYKNTILMGVGFDSAESSYDQYTKRFFSEILSKKYIHSVRDSFSEQKLKEMGIENVMNTCCPTMWNLTLEHCKQIPVHKARHVVCTITDYNQDRENDRLMLEILFKNYEKVYLWLQGDKDLEYIKSLDLRKQVLYVSQDLKSYEEILEKKDLDYVGTRLHAGIKALSTKHRTIIIAIDNRALAISYDTELPIIIREHIKTELNDKINSSFTTCIHIPTENINIWKNQFRNLR